MDSFRTEKYLGSVFLLLYRFSKNWANSGRTFQKVPPSFLNFHINGKKGQNCRKSKTKYGQRINGIVLCDDIFLLYYSGCNLFKIVLAIEAII